MTKKKILLLSVGTILVISLLFNGLLLLRIVNNDSQDDSVSDKHQLSEEGDNKPEVIITHNLVPAPQTECTNPDLGIDLFLDEKQGNIWLSSYDEDKDILINSGDLKANLEDFENGWEFINPTFIFSDCRWVLLTQKFNFTTGGGFQEETWLYDRLKNKMEHLKDWTYAIESISADYQKVLLWGLPQNTDEYITAWLLPDGTKQEIDIASHLADGQIMSFGHWDGRKPVVSNKGDIFFFVMEQVEDSNSDNINMEYYFYHYYNDQVEQVYKYKQETHFGLELFDEETKTFVILASDEDNSVPRFQDCYNGYCRYDLLHQYQLQ